MDESKMNYISAILFKHMHIGTIFYAHPAALTFDEINDISQNKGISRQSLDLVITDLVAHGILSTYYNDNYQLSYCITDFGQYFFRQFCSVNEDAAKLCGKVDDDKNEADGPY